VTVIPINGDFIPRRSNHRAKIGLIVLPANTVADVEKSRLAAVIYSDRAHIFAPTGEIVRFGR
jgi:hypothetical protein